VRAWQVQGQQGKGSLRDCLHFFWEQYWGWWQKTLASSFSPESSWFCALGWNSRLQLLCGSWAVLNLQRAGAQEPWTTASLSPRSAVTGQIRLAPVDGMMFIKHLETEVCEELYLSGSCHCLEQTSRDFTPSGAQKTSERMAVTDGSAGSGQAAPASSSQDGRNQPGCSPPLAVQISGSAESPATGWHCPGLVGVAVTERGHRHQVWPPAGPAPALAAGKAAWPSPPRAVPPVEQGLGPRTLLGAQRSRCPARQAMDTHRVRHLAFPFVELARTHSCQAWDSPSHLAKQENIINPVSSPAPAPPTATETRRRSREAPLPPARKLPKEGLNQSQLKSLALY